MSDGLSDAAALGRLERELDAKLYDFAEALRDATCGHRGLVIVPDVHAMNRGLIGTGYRITYVGDGK